MAKKKKEDKNEFKDVERCDYCIHNKGKNESFGFMWYCENMKRYLPQGYNYCVSSKQQKGEFEVDKIKYKQFKNMK